MDKLRNIEVFVTAVDTGNFSEAARRLAITPVMVGKHVRQLEDHLRTRLLQRSTRKQSLTDTGRRFYEDCKKVLEQLRWAEASVESLRVRPSGRLRISAPTTLGECVVAPLAAHYQNAHHEVHIELELSNSMVDLIDESFDLAIRIGELDPTLNLVARPLGRYAMVICAAPAYLARHGTPTSPEQLAAHRCLGHMAWNRGNAWQLQSESGADDLRWPQDTPFVCNDGQALRQAALQGAGLLLQPRVLVADDLTAGHLVSVLEAHTPASRPIHILYRQDRRPLPKMTSFIDFLRRHPIE